MAHTLTEWVIFNAVMILLIVVDLGVFSRKAHVIHVREAMIRSLVWIALAFLFAVFVFARHGRQSAIEFVAAYVTEETLSVDNLFVMLIIFSYFQVPRHHQHKALLWGIIGALVFRAIFILAGLELIDRFHWMLKVMGAVLVYTAVKLLVSEEQYDPQTNLFLRFSRRFLPVTENYVEDRFFVRRNGRLMMTPLFVVLWVINTTDVVFAFDSVPAVFGVVDSKDPFIVYTSNACAILGLRSLYFALAGMLEAFHFLRYGLSAILAFVGVKMLVDDWVKIGPGLTLGIVAACLILSVIASLVCKKRVSEADGDVGTPEVRSQSGI